MTFPNVYQEIQDERSRQDVQWGGHEHDDEHARHEWNGFIAHQMSAAATAVVQDDQSAWRERMIKIAALAVAAVESHDRRVAP